MHVCPPSWYCSIRTFGAPLLRRSEKRLPSPTCVCVVMVGRGRTYAVSCMQRTWYGSRKTCEGTDSLCRFSAASLEPSRGLREGDGCDVCGKGGKQP